MRSALLYPGLIFTMSADFGKGARIPCASTHGSGFFWRLSMSIGFCENGWIGGNSDNDGNGRKNKSWG
jgi:hypothetical protein